MRKLDRGPCPEALGTAEAKELTKAIKHFVEDGHKDGFTFGAYKSKAVKRALSASSGGRCAYCEEYYDATEPVDVEHFRPKGGVQQFLGLKQPGYWWLAARWDNLLPSCIRCNREETLPLYDGTEVKLGKGNHFPLDDEGQRATAQGEEALEVPLLINPCVEDPKLHIHFVEEAGKCVARAVDPDKGSLSARRARASIDTYGLNRDGLVTDRTRYMGRAFFAVAQIEFFIRLTEETEPGPTRVAIDENIREQLIQLGKMIRGDDRFVGVLSGLVEPRLARIGLSLEDIPSPA